MLKRRVPLISVVLVLLVLGGFALAGRNSAGTYSLPSGNPVVTGTTITSTWANNTLNDIKTEITNSLDRQGRGGMQAPLQLVDGTASAPGLTWGSELTSGLSRAGAGDQRMSVLTTAVMKWTSALNTSLVPFTVTGRTTTSDLTVTGTSDALIVTPLAANTQAILATGTGTANGIFAQGGPTSGLGIFAQGGAPNGTGSTGVGQGTGTGVNAVGGSSAGVGVRAQGGAAGIGLVALAGTTASVTTPRDAITSTNGYISLDGAVSPNPIAPGNGAHAATKNRIVPKSLTQAWASVEISGGAMNILDTYGISSITEANPSNCSTYAITVTFDSPFLGTTGSGLTSYQYAAVVGSKSSNIIAPHCQPVVLSKNTTQLLVAFTDQAGSRCSRTGACSQVNSEGFELIVTGAQ